MTLADVGHFDGLQEDFVCFGGELNDNVGELFVDEDDICCQLVGLDFYVWFSEYA